MGSPLPNVLTNDEVKKLLQDVVEKEGISDPVYTVAAGSNKGDGYLSFMTKVDVKGNGKDLHLIVKCAPSAEEFRSFAPVRAQFLREMFFYQQIYPAMVEYQEENAIKNRFNSVAKFYKAINTDMKEVLVLENIRERGFQPCDRKKQMDDQHYQMLFTEYAKFHAFSFALKEQHKEKYYMLSKELFDMFTPGIFNLDFLKGFAMCLEDIANLYEDREIKQQLIHLKENVDTYFEHIINNKGKNVIITHGDCWCSNMMFKYNDPTDLEKLTDLCLFDFQLIRKGSPVLDLSYFFYASAPKHLLSKLDNYLQLYYSVLGEQLANYGLKIDQIITFEELKNDWKLYGKFGYVMGIMTIKGSLTESDEIIDIADMTSNPDMSVDDIFRRNYKNQHLMNERQQDLTNHMHENGYLEFQY